MNQTGLTVRQRYECSEFSDPGDLTAQNFSNSDHKYTRPLILFSEQVCIHGLPGQNISVASGFFDYIIFCNAVFNHILKLVVYLTLRGKLGLKLALTFKGKEQLSCGLLLESLVAKPNSFFLRFFFNVDHF